jgi:hypothetical protein
MKTITREKSFPRTFNRLLARALVVAGFFICALNGLAQLPPGAGGTNSSPTYTLLESWSFRDSVNWTSDSGTAPVDFTNLASSYLGLGSSLSVNTNVPAWLHFNLVETNNATNLCLTRGSVVFWVAPSWASTNAGGTGSGVFGRLLEVGTCTPDSSHGWWSIYVDDVGQNIYFSAQTNDLSSNITTYVSAPISWTTNYFHLVALTFSATNSALYLDGELMTNGPGVTVYPGPNVQTNGFFIGSDALGQNQVCGLLGPLTTYAEPLDADTVAEIFDDDYRFFMLYPQNTAMFRFFSAEAGPSVTPTPNVVTGQGNLQILGATPTCSYGTNAYQVWITNVTATVAANGTMDVTFAIGGGQDGFFYDVFAGNSLTSPLGNGYWSWQGQGQHCYVYSLTNLPQGTVFLVLGTPYDLDEDGLTSAYENLVSKTDPNNADTDGDGIPDGWEVLLGMNPLINDNAQSASRANYGYTLADWLNSVSGIRSGSVSLDNEGNVLSVSQ